MKVKVGDWVRTHGEAWKVIHAYPQSGFFGPGVVLENRRGWQLGQTGLDARALEPSLELAEIEAMNVAGRLGF